MAQFARPTSDVAAGDWGDSPLWSKLDEVVADDADFITGVGDAACEVALGSISEPGSGDVTLRVRYRKQTGSEDASLQVDLLDGATVVATRTVAASSTSFATAEFVLTAGERAAISDWADLRVRLTRLPFGEIFFNGKAVLFGGSPLTFTS